MGRADYFKAGDYNADCARCGDKFKASELRQEWDGYKVCRRCFEPRNAQDLIRPMNDDLAPPWTQPEQPDKFLFVPGHEDANVVGGFMFGGALMG